jgi:hypothetical protein
VRQAWSASHELSDTCGTLLAASSKKPRAHAGQRRHRGVLYKIIILDVTSPPVVVPYSPDRIRLLVSPQRMAPYLRQSDGDPDGALRLYEWSSRQHAIA